MNKLLTAITSSLCSIAATAMLFSSVNSVSANTNNYDVNQDGKINIIDILVIKDFLLSDDVPSTVEIPAATAESIVEVTDMSEVTVEEQVILDRDGVKVTLKDMTSDKYGIYFKFALENNTDKDLIIKSMDESVNGYMYDIWFYEEVLAGKKSIYELTFYNSSLERSEISIIEELEFKIRCIDMNTNDNYFTTWYNRIRTSAYHKPVTAQTIPVEQPIIVTEASNITTEPNIEATTTETTTEATAVATTVIETTTATEAITKESECLNSMVRTPRSFSSVG